MEIFARVHTWLERISRVAVWVGGGALMLCAIMVTVDVICRKLFSITMSGSDEISGYVFAAGTTWAYSYCLLHRSNVRIDALYNMLPIWLRAIADAIGVALLLVYMSYLTVKGYGVFITSWKRDSVSITTLATPLWIPELFWLAGLVLFCFTLAFLLLYVLTSLVRRDFSTVQKVAGAMSVEEELEEEALGVDVHKHAR